MDSNSRLDRKVGAMRSVEVAAKISAEIRGLRAEANKDELMYFIEKNPGLCAYELSRKLGWSRGKVKYYVDKLLEDNEIRIETERNTDRIKKRIYPIKWTEMIDWNKLEK